MHGIYRLKTQHEISNLKYSEETKPEANKPIKIETYNRNYCVSWFWNAQSELMLWVDFQRREERREMKGLDDGRWNKNG